MLFAKFKLLRVKVNGQEETVRIALPHKAGHEPLSRQLALRQLGHLLGFLYHYYRHRAIKGAFKYPVDLTRNLMPSCPQRIITLHAITL